MLRLNGYYPPHRFRAALDYVAGKHEGRIAFATCLERHAREPASGRLHVEPFFMKPPYRLAGLAAGAGKAAHRALRAEAVRGVATGSTSAACATPPCGI